MVSRTYPDQEQVQGLGHGSGFSNMGAIIHDFARYNERVQHEFSSLLNAGLTVVQRELVDRVAEESIRRGMALYAVGGLPRDLWLRTPVTDLDLVVEGDAIGLARALSSRYGGTVTAHTRFGTAKWDLRGAAFEGGPDLSLQPAQASPRRFLDIVSARRETYRHPGALPTVKPGTIADDVLRRDFSINTLAVRLDGPHFGEVLDEFGAIRDLQAGTVRVLHPRSFLDDPTRMYRAVRYEQRFGFGIAETTVSLMGEARPLLRELSGQRIRHELDLMLDEAAGAAMLGRLAQLGLLQPVHPALPRARAALDRVAKAGEVPVTPVQSWSRRHAAWMLWFIDLDEARIKSLGKRLRMPRVALRDHMAAARLYAESDSVTRRKPSRCTARLDEYPALAVYTTSLVLSGKPKRVLEKYLAEWRRAKPTVTGHDLKRLGLEPGPAYRKILRGLRSAWIDGLVTNSDEERQLLHSLLQRAESPRPKVRERGGSKGKATKSVSRKG